MSDPPGVHQLHEYLGAGGMDGIGYLFPARDLRG